MTTIGSVQDKIITALAQSIETSTWLARSVYGLKVDAMPTRSQGVSIRRALRTLERAGVVRLTNQLRGRKRCWELTGTLVPEKKRPVPHKKPLAVVK